MKTEKIGAEKLYEAIEDYPDLVELLVNGQWHEIDRITNHRIDNGVWASTGDVIYIECGHQEYTYQFMDELTIRYPDLDKEQSQWELGLDIESDDEYLDDDSTDNIETESEWQDRQAAREYDLAQPDMHHTPTHPAFIRPKELAQANTCPQCGSQGYVSLERQEVHFNHDRQGSTIRIENGFMCMDCSACWSQTIVAKVGDVISNTVELER